MNSYHVNYLMKFEIEERQKSKQKSTKDLIQVIDMKRLDVLRPLWELGA